MSDQTAKTNAARAAVRLVENGMRVGLGTGSTAAIFIDLLGERVRAEGLSITAIPSSRASEQRARAAGIELVAPGGNLDITVDGADEFDDALDLIKGGGGALLREKMLAVASRKLVIIADKSKRVERLGRFPLAVEIVPFGVAWTIGRIRDSARAAGVETASCSLRGGTDTPYVSDNGLSIVDLSCGAIPDSKALADSLAATVGVVEHGLFVGLTGTILVGSDGGVRALKPA